MIWETLILFAVSFLATALLSPRPQFEDARPQGLDSLRVPQASEGSATPFILGKVRQRGANTIWFGGFESTAITRKQRTGLFSSKRITIGFEYRIILNMALGLGPGVKLHEIYLEKEKVYESSEGLSIAGESVIVDMPDLYGGPERGGGFSGRFVFYPGNFDQERDPTLMAGLNTDQVPGYVGVSHVVIKSIGQNSPNNFFGQNSGDLNSLGACIGESPQLRPISFVISRYPNTLGAQSPIIGEDLNPACAIFEVLTSDWGGLSVPENRINKASFLEISNTLALEKNGISLIISRSQSGSDIIQEILRQIDGVLYQDSQSGLFTLYLIRADFDVDDIPEFNENNVVSIRNYNRTSWEETVNQIRITYNSREKGYEAASGFSQDLANINSQMGRIRSSNISFPGVTENLLASQLATRELSQLSIPLVRATLNLQRSGSSLRPGQPFNLSWPDFGIERVTMRVTRFNLGELVQGNVVIDAIQDALSVGTSLFSDPTQSLFSPPSNTLFTNPDREALEITNALLIEAPYWFLEHTGQNFISTPPNIDHTYVFAYATIPASSQVVYSVSLSQDGFNLDANIGIERATYPPQARLIQSDINEFDGFDFGFLSSIIIDNVLDISTLNNEDDRVNGGGLFFLNNEILSYETFTDNMDGTYRLNNIRRALLDSTFETHSIGDTLFFADITYIVEDEYNSNILLQARYSSSSIGREFGFENASNVDLTLKNRYNLPLPPKNLLANNTRTQPSIRLTRAQDQMLSLEWLERSRNNPLIALNMTDAGTGENGQSYEIDIVSDDEVVMHSTFTSNVASIEIPLEQIPIGLQRIQVYSILDNLRSFIPETAYIEVTLPMGTPASFRIPIINPSPVDGNSEDDWTQEIGSGFTRRPTDLTRYVLGSSSQSVVYQDIELDIDIHSEIDAGRGRLTLSHSIETFASDQDRAYCFADFYDLAGEFLSRTQTDMTTIDTPITQTVSDMLISPLSRSVRIGWIGRRISGNELSVYVRDIIGDIDFEANTLSALLLYSSEDASDVDNFTETIGDITQVSTSDTPGFMGYQGGSVPETIAHLDFNLNPEWVTKVNNGFVDIGWQGAVSQGNGDDTVAIILNFFNSAGTDLGNSLDTGQLDTNDFVMAATLKGDVPIDTTMIRMTYHYIRNDGTVSDALIIKPSLILIENIL